VVETMIGKETHRRWPRSHRIYESFPPLQIFLPTGWREGGTNHRDKAANKDSMLKCLCILVLARESHTLLVPLKVSHWTFKYHV
jgi:hypothetical protein